MWQTLETDPFVHHPVPTLPCPPPQMPPLSSIRQLAAPLP